MLWPTPQADASRGQDADSLVAAAVAAMETQLEEQTQEREEGAANVCAARQMGASI